MKLLIHYILLNIYLILHNVLYLFNITHFTYNIYIFTYVHILYLFIYMLKGDRETRKTFLIHILYIHNLSVPITPFVQCKIKLTYYIWSIQPFEFSQRISNFYVNSLFTDKIREYIFTCLQLI